MIGNIRLSEKETKDFNEITSKINSSIMMFHDYFPDFANTYSNYISEIFRSSMNAPAFDLIFAHPINRLLTEFNNSPNKGNHFMFLLLLMFYISYIENNLLSSRLQVRSSFMLDNMFSWSKLDKIFFLGRKTDKEFLEDYVLFSSLIQVYSVLNKFDFNQSMISSDTIIDESKGVNMGEIFPFLVNEKIELIEFDLQIILNRNNNIYSEYRKEIK